MVKMVDHFAYWLCPLLAVLQWVILFPIAVKQNIIRKIAGKHFGYKEETKTIPFVEDYFFILWNIFPIFLFAIQYIIMFSWIDWSGEFLRLNSGEVNKLFLEFERTRHMPLAIYLFGSFALYSSLWQVVKQKKIQREQKTIYWWDIRISKTIFYLRMFFLVFNFFLIIYLVWSAVLLGKFIIDVLRLDYLCLPFFHPDRSCGTGVLLELARLLSLIFLFASGVGAAALIDHGLKHGKVQIFGDLFLLALIIPALVLVLYPPLIARERLQKEITGLSSMADQIIEEEFREYGKLRIAENASTEIVKKNFSDFLQEKSSKLLILREIQEIKINSFGFRDLFSMISSWFSPIFVWVALRVYARKPEESFFGEHPS